MRLSPLALAALALACPALAVEPAPKPLTGQTTVTFFIEAQDVPAFGTEEMAARTKVLGGDVEAVAADNALNLWKGCVAESLVRWASLAQGPGTLIDGAFGRCADLERDYRMHLTRMTPGGRQVVDVQLARTMTRTLEEAWRPRLTATVLEAALAKQQAAPAAAAPARDPAARPRDERQREERTAPRG